MITIVNYGCGNIFALVNVFKRLNIEINVATTPEDFSHSSKIILPGVGSFDYVMKRFNVSGMREIVEKKALIDKIPVLGICAGMQILSNKSEEGVEKGLGWIEGEVKRFDTSKIPFITKLPHMGWNEIVPKENPLFNGIETGARFYFVHSYYFQCKDDSDSIAITNYGINFTSAVNKENIFGVQFHPEKSHQNGETLLLNFARL